MSELVGQPELFSYSKLDVFSQCGYKYKLAYVDKYKAFSDSVATEIGTCIHSAEEQIAKYLQANLPVDYVLIKNTFLLKLIAIKYKYPITYYIPDKSGRTYDIKLQEYLTSTIYNLETFMREHPAYKIVGIEQGFTYTFNGYTFRGFIDRVFFDSASNTYIIQDIKTYASELEPAKLATPLQFVIYAKALKDLYNITAENIKCQYYLPFCKITQDAGTTNYIVRGEKKINSLLLAIQNAEFEPKPSPLCAFCDYSSTNTDANIKFKYLCPYHSLWTREKKSFAVANKWAGFAVHHEILNQYLKLNNITISQEGSDINGESNKTNR